MNRSILAASKNLPAGDRLIKPRMRVIIDNDFSGDPDDLFQIVHHLLCPSIELVGIIGSHLAVVDKYDSSKQQAENAVRKVHEVLKVMGVEGGYPVFQGSNVALSAPDQPIANEASEMIVREAMRADSDLPLFVLCGGGLTEIASAWLMEPRIGERLTLAWIGGREYPGLGPPPAPGAVRTEYNLNIDRIAAQIIFNNADIPLWQVPRNLYRQFLMGFAEIAMRVRPHGPAGDYLYKAIEHEAKVTYPNTPPGGHGETYVMGDSALVTLSALHSTFQPDPSSSWYIQRPAPFLTEDGLYLENPKGRSIRVYTQMDVRLTFEDLYLKLQMFARDGA